MSEIMSSVHMVIGFPQNYEIQLQYFLCIISHARTDRTLKYNQKYHSDTELELSAILYKMSHTLATV